MINSSPVIFTRGPRAEGSPQLPASVRIRSEIPTDVRDISAVIALAFTGHPHGGKGVEEAIVRDLRTAKALTLSLVAEAKPESNARGLPQGIIGHVAFSPVEIIRDTGDGGREAAEKIMEGAAGGAGGGAAGPEVPGWYGLGPLAVHPDWQRQGLGTALVAYGLDILRGGGANGCVLVGEPGYYSRFGFTAGHELFLPEFPPEYFLSLAFSVKAEETRGSVRYHPAFEGG